MRLLSKFVLIAAALSFTVPAYAQEGDAYYQVEEDPTPAFDPATYTRYRLPEGRRCQSGGQTYQCFTVEEYVQLLEMDVDLAFYDEAYPIAQQVILNLEVSITELELSLDAANEEIQYLTEDRDRIFEKWKKENKLRLECENTPSLSSIFGWSLSAVELVVIATLSVIMGVSL